MAINTVTSRNSPNTIVITDRDQNQITVTQPVTSTVEVGAVGPQGQKGETGPAGPTGSSQPFSYVEGTTWATTSSLEVSGSFLVSGSSTFTNIGPAIFSGSVESTQGFTGSFKGDGAGLYDIPASAITGLNLSQIASGSATASISPDSGFRVNTSTEITGSLLVSGSSDYTFTSGDGLILNRDGAGNYIRPRSQPLVLYSPNSSIYQYINNSGIGINTPPSARFHIKGSGTTSATTAFRVENANTQEIISADSGGNIKIATQGGISGSISIGQETSGNYGTRTITINSYDDPRIVLQGHDTWTRWNIKGGVNSSLRLYNDGDNHTGNTVEIGTTTTGNGRLSLVTNNADFLEAGTNPSVKAVKLGLTDQSQNYVGSLYIDASKGVYNYSRFTFRNTGNLEISGSLLGAGLQLSGSNSTIDGNLTVTGSLITSAFTASSAVINGDVTIHGTASVDVLITNYESSSIIYSSGSTKFGDTMDDTHQFTGSLYVTGSLNILDTVPTITLTDSGTSGGIINFNVNNAKIDWQSGGFQFRYQNSARLSLSSDTTQGLKAWTLTAGNVSWVNGGNGLTVANNAGNGRAIIGADAPTVSTYRTAEARLHVRGEGTTSSTTALLVQNSNASASLSVLDNGYVGIGTSTPTAALEIYKSGSTVLDVQGSQGQLFSVVDELSGSLMSVNDISGLPILEVFSDDTVVMGTYGAPGLTVSGSSASTGDLTVSGSLTVRTIGNATQITSVIQAGTGSLALVPSGSGAIVAAIPDGTTAGGNARGQYAVDLQMSRTAADQVANGSYSFVCGYGNSASAEAGVTLGFLNTNSGIASGILSGRSNINTALRSVISGGFSNLVSSAHSVISGGQSNTASTNTHATVVGGQSNTASGQYSVAGGIASVASGKGSVAIGTNDPGAGCVSSGIGSVAMGGRTTASGNFSVTFGTTNLTNSGTASFLMGDSNGNTGGYNATFGRFNSNSNTYNLTFGQGAIGAYRGALSFQSSVASTNASDRGIAQSHELTMQKTADLTSAATTVLYIDGVGANLIPYNANTAWMTTVKWVAIVTAITGTATGVTVGDAIYGTSEFGFKRLSGTSSITSLIRDSIVADTAIMETATLTYSAGASQELALTFTAPTFSGGGNLTVRVVAKVELTEVAY